VDPRTTGEGDAAAPRRRPFALSRPDLARGAGRLAQAGIPFGLITYLGLQGGGYDVVVRSEVGFMAWWVVLLGTLVGALPLARLPRRAWTALGILGAFALWTGLGISWSESAERSVGELGRVATLIGLFVLALCVQTGDGLRRMVGGVAAGVAVVAGIALLSRFEPSWFPALETPAFIEGSRTRLHYPLDYWNGLAAFVAIGLPLLAALVVGARHIAGRALAAAAIPVLALTLFFTLSRGGALTGGVALAVLAAMHPARLTLAAGNLPALAGSVILVLAADGRDALADGLTTDASAAQGDEMLALTVVVCAVVGLLTAGAELAQRRGLLPELRPPRVPAGRRAAAAAGVGVAVALVLALAAGAPGAASDAWDDFKDPDVPEAEAGRFESASGSGRYQFWEAAADAGSDQPLTGIGPGTYEYYWAREGSLPTFIRDAHSLYMETFAESGMVGLLLVLAAVATPFALGTRRLRSLVREPRSMVAAATAGCVAFVVAAGLDWAWELTVLPAIFMFLAAALIARPVEGDGDRTWPAPWRARLALSALAAVSLIAIAIPMLSADAVHSSEGKLQAGDTSGALDDARFAADVEPWAASPKLQEAVVLEARGDVANAVVAARDATEAESTNWRTWLVLSRLEAQTGNFDGSVAAYREARSLNPRSPLFQ
jgi:hypothetical protein